ncbi:efflux RND transporter permease subunit [Natrialba taiwanensis]|uniref:Rnd superfamily exporter n=1 Tax=Natrialba taiwanensis DSM 12281 TaxID=1230458 RepID=M0ACY6_9EURY|nr:MMPL family transporter [Natrialba taiwanensis]ELY96261.1 rnd superfamily exporter [Natrialba taiwanensis DSM 12281]
MKRNLPSRYADALISRSKLIIVLLLVLTAIIGAGAVVGTSADGEIGRAGIDSEEQAALEEIESTYETDDSVVTQIVIKDADGDVLTRESLLQSLRLQQEIRENESINTTLQAESGLLGLENIVATTAYVETRTAENGTHDTTASRNGRPPAPTLDQQIEALKTRSDEEVDALLARVLDPASTASDRDPTPFLPSDYEPGETSADARLTLVFQSDESGGASETPQEAYDAQVAIASLVDERFDDAFVFGQGIIDEASSQAIGDSFLIITPVALVLLLIVLSIAYRDIVDVLISLFGIGVVMVWLQGIQGWLGIPSSSILIAVPFLLIGLSIDYSLHVVMRYREARTGDLGADTESDSRRSPPTAMRAGIAGVVVALAAAAFTTGIGFFSNYVSPLGSIQDFALLSAAGIIAMFVVFAALVPAVKLEVERLLSRLGRDRQKSAFGVSSGPIRRVLSGTATLSQRIPIAVLVVSLLIASVGAYGATGLDTEFNQADFLPEDAPGWMESLPEPFAPAEYDVRENLEYLSDNFRQRGQGSEAQILIRENVTTPALLTATDDTSQYTSRNGTIAMQSDGTATIETPATVLRSVAAENETVAAAIDARDVDGDGLPDEDIAQVYDLVYDVAPDRASTVLYQTENGSYATARLTVGVETDAAAQSIASDVRQVATGIEANAPVTAVATGGPVITAVAQSALFETLVEGFAVTLGVILTFLLGLYWWRYRAPGLAVVVLIPVLLALAWLLGTMALLDIPFNSETVVITSLAIGLGVDYSIHLCERFVDERERRESLDESLVAAVTGTGGALLGSAATTAAGFGVLALALSPPLHRFGLVTGLSIIFAFVSCVTVLPSLLVVRERYVR